MRLTPKALEEFYTDARGLNIFGMLKSPMVLMMLFSGIMMFAVPKLMVSARPFPWPISPLNNAALTPTPGKPRSRSGDGSRDSRV
jgi:hypothetical protein